VAVAVLALSDKTLNLILMMEMVAMAGRVKFLLYRIFLLITLVVAVAAET
jgi:hypothetical protein